MACIKYYLLRYFTFSIIYSCVISFIYIYLQILELDLYIYFIIYSFVLFQICLFHAIHIAKKKTTADGNFYKVKTRTFEIFAQNIYQVFKTQKLDETPNLLLTTIPILVIKVIPIYLPSFSLVKFCFCLFICLFACFSN